MAKQGLPYFPLDTDIFQNPKIKLIEARFEHKGVYIVIRLLAEIYRDKGYYLNYGEDESLLFANSVGMAHSLVNDVVQESIKRGLFDKTLFNKFKILTSREIQNRYTHAVKSAKLKRDPIPIEYAITAFLEHKNILHSESSEHIPKSTEDFEKTSEDFAENPPKRKEKKVKEREETKREIHAHTLESESWLNGMAARHKIPVPRVRELTESIIADFCIDLRIDRYRPIVLVKIIADDFAKKLSDVQIVPAAPSKQSLADKNRQMEQELLARKIKTTGT